jgi:hypothetical protein
MATLSAKASFASSPETTSQFQLEKKQNAQTLCEFISSETIERNLDVNLPQGALNSWEDYHFDRFLTKVFRNNERRQQILKRIATNDEWFEETKAFRKIGATKSRS